MDWFPRSALETIFELESDRLMNLAIDPDVVETERGGGEDEAFHRNPLEVGG